MTAPVFHRHNDDAVAVYRVHRRVMTTRRDDNCSRVRLPFLPVTGEAERRLFNTLTTQVGEQFQLMAVEWAQHVDGRTVFPKLPAQLRLHQKEWARSTRVRAAFKREKSNLEQLKALLHTDTIVAPLPIMPQNLLAPTPHVATVEVTTQTQDGSDGERGEQVVGEEPAGQEVAPVVNTVAVAGLMLNAPVDAAPSQKRKLGQRRHDRQKRKTRTCRLCSHHGGARADECKGRGPRGTCEYFTDEGYRMRDDSD